MASQVAKQPHPQHSRSSRDHSKSALDLVPACLCARIPHQPRVSSTPADRATNCHPAPTELSARGSIKSPQPESMHTPMPLHPDSARGNTLATPTSSASNATSTQVATSPASSTPSQTPASTSCIPRPFRHNIQAPQDYMSLQKWNFCS
jgi:hypothetical protein